MISNKQKLFGLLSKLSRVASNSQINHQHAAVLIHNGNPVVWGFNTIKGHKTHHAECDVIRRFLISRGNLGYVKEQSILWGCKKQYQK
jgi:hypothetical protein